MPPERLDDVEEAWDEALEAAQALETAKHRLSGKCWDVDSIPGPHPGCAEFAPPELHPCQEAGAVWVLDDTPDPEWVLLCTRHAEIAQLEDSSLGFSTTTAKR